MSGENLRGAIVYASGMEQETISRQFSPDENGTLLEYVLDSVWTVADELNVAFKNDPDLSVVESISPFGARIFNASGEENSVDPILSAFKNSKAELCILATEKVPLLKPNVVLALFNAAQGYDLAIPRWNDGRLEPLLAVYRGKALLRLASSKIIPSGASVDAAMESFVNHLFDVKYVSIEEELAELDPELDSFLKVVDGNSLTLARSKASVRGTRMKKSD